MVIVIAGVAGVGKTTVGRRLADEIGWPFHDADDYHSPASVARMQDGLPLDEQHRAPWLESLATLIAEQTRAESSMVLACSALTRAHREALLSRTDRPGDVRLVHLTANEALIADRLRQRRGHFFPQTLLASQLMVEEPPAPDEPMPVLLVDAAQPVHELVAGIRKTLRV